MLEKIIFKLNNFINNKIHSYHLKSIKGKQLSSKSQITKGFKILNKENLEVEDYVYIGPDAFISCFGKVLIKRGTIIGPRIIIHTANHNYINDIKSIPYDKELLVKDVIIEENVWIGDSVIIVPGVTIGEGSIIAAGSVIIKDIPKFSIVGGNPARVIKERPNVADYLKNKELDNIYLKGKKND